MPVLLDHQNVNFNGTRDFGPVSVPPGTTQFKISLVRCTTVTTPNLWADPATTIDGLLFISNDGMNWIGAGGMGARGGIIIKPGGGELAESSTSGTIPDPLGAGWQIKATVIVVNGPLRSQITVEVN